MDLSKLPKLSQTPSPTTPSATPENPVAEPVPVQPIPAYRVPDPMFSGGEIWFNLVVGIIFMLLGRGFGGYAIAKITHQPHHTGQEWREGPKAGQEVDYPELEGNVFASESAMFLFGLAVALDAGLRVVIDRGTSWSRPLAYLAFGIIVAATVYNLYVVGVLLKRNTMPFISLMAVAFGGYIAIYQWRLIWSFKR